MAFADTKDQTRHICTAICKVYLGLTQKVNAPVKGHRDFCNERDFNLVGWIDRDSSSHGRLLK